jgi:hypothetical protein
VALQGRRTDRCRFVGNGARVDKRPVEPGLPSSLLLLPQGGGLLSRAGQEERPARIEVALQVNPPDERREVECRATPALEDVPGGAAAERPLNVDEADTRVVAEPPGRQGRPSPADDA